LAGAAPKTAKTTAAADRYVEAFILRGRRLLGVAFDVEVIRTASRRALITSPLAQSQLMADIAASPVASIDNRIS
jgi:hypothetical protein